jgi:hypothetical protein
MADAEGVDEAIERNLAPLFDCFKQVSYRGFAVAFFVLQLDLLVARLERKNVGRFLDPFLPEEQLDLLFTQTFDIEGTA